MQRVSNQQQQFQSQNIKQRQQQQIEPMKKKQLKILQAKFLPYVNQLNSSIIHCRSHQNRSKNRLIQKRQSLNCKSNYKPNLKFDCYETNSLQAMKKGKAGRQQNCSNNGYRQMRSSGSKDQRSLNYNIVEGSIIDGRIHGKAVIQLSNGCKFEGDVQNGQIKQGMLHYKNGTIYRGQLNYGMIPHGKGSLKLKNGIQYKGNFNNGLIQDRGTILYDNGDIYNGRIKNYKKHGFGELIFANGDKYIGDFTEGEITGQGVFYQCQKIIAEGIWKNGEFLGRKTQKLTQSITQLSFKRA